MTGEDGTAVDDDILAGLATQTAVLVLTALDADAVVASIELRIDDEGILARLQIERITILGVGGIAGEDIVDDDILAHQRMDVPRRRILEDDTLQQHVLTADQRNHHRTQETLVAIPFSLAVGLDNIHVGILLGIGIALRGHPVVVANLHTTRAVADVLPLSGSDLRLLDGTPILTVTVDDATSRNGDILTAIGRQRRLTATGVQALKRGLDDFVELLVTREQNDSPYLQMEIDVGLQLNGACKPHTGRNQQTAPTLTAQLVDSLCKSVGIERNTITDGTEVLQVHLTVGKRWCTDLRHLERQLLSVVLVRIFAVGTGLAVLAVVFLCRGAQRNA